MNKQLASPVSLHALRQRLKRKLAGEGKTLRTARSEKARDQLGKFHIIAGDTIVQTNVDIVALAKKMDLLQAWETPAF